MNGVPQKPFSRLNQEVRELSLLISASRALHQVAQAVQLLLTNIVSALGEDCRVLLYGSVPTGLATVWSDINVAVEFPQRNTFVPLPEQLYISRFITSMLQQCGDLQVETLLEKNNYAALELRHVLLPETPIRVSFNQRHALQSAEFISQFIHAHPSAKPLILVLKAFIHEFELTNTVSTSYTITLIAISFFRFFLNNCVGQFNTPPGCSLYFFLEFFQEEGLFSSQRSELRPSERAGIVDLPMQNPYSIWILRDPIHPSNERNLCGKLIEIHTLRRLFSHLYRTVLAEYFLPFNSPGASIGRPHISSILFPRFAQKRREARDHEESVDRSSSSTVLSRPPDFFAQYFSSVEAVFDKVFVTDSIDRAGK